MKARHGITILGLAVVAAIWLLTRPAPLASMHHACSTPETNASAASFSGRAGEQIKISLSSNVKDGVLDISLLDLQGNVVKQLGHAKQLKTVLTLDRSDTYTLRAEYSDFAGDFSVAVYHVD